MDKNKYDIIRLRMERTAKALRKNNIFAQCCESVEEIPDLLSEMLCEGDTVSVGGSVSLFEAGVIDFLRNGNYDFLDRYREGLTKPDIDEIYRKSYYADAYFCSANAVTENGELYCVDGTGNRISAMIYGPKSVILIVGYNKIVRDLDEAYDRVKNLAAPANCKRLNMGTPCTKFGSCVDCFDENCICATEVVFSRQRFPDRIKVILVGEELGY